MQYNDDGWCGCLALAEGVTFRDATNGPRIHGEVSECMVCDLTSVCHEEICHNDGHWTEVAFPEATELLGCFQQCILHPEATAFQYNDDGFCGCLTLAKGATFADAITGPHIHGEATACTINLRYRRPRFARAAAAAAAGLHVRLERGGAPQLQCCDGCMQWLRSLLHARQHSVGLGGCHAVRLCLSQ
jgi:hypothetical protein